MVDEQFPQPATESDAPKDSTGAPLPDHLKPEWFDEGVAVPAFMASNPNWMNQASTNDETVHVRMGDGSYQKTTSPIHLGVWLLQGHGVIIADPAPKEEEAK